MLVCINSIDIELELEYCVTLRCVALPCLALRCVALRCFTHHSLLVVFAVAVAAAYQLVPLSDDKTR